MIWSRELQTPFSSSSYLVQPNIQSRQRSKCYSSKLVSISHWIIALYYAWNPTRHCLLHYQNVAVFCKPNQITFIEGALNSVLSFVHYWYLHLLFRLWRQEWVYHLFWYRLGWWLWNITIYHWLCHVSGKWDHFLAFTMIEKSMPFFHRSRICWYDRDSMSNPMDMKPLWRNWFYPRPIITMHW